LRIKVELIGIKIFLTKWRKMRERKDYKKENKKERLLGLTKKRLINGLQLRKKYSRNKSNQEWNFFKSKLRMIRNKDKKRQRKP